MKTEKLSELLKELVSALKAMDSAVKGSENDDFECSNNDAVKKMRAAIVRADNFEI